MTKRAIITGAGSGIGRAIALALAREGVETVLAGRRREALEETAMQVALVGPEAAIVPTDVADPAACRALVAAARDLGGSVEPVLVNNAGIGEFGDFAKSAAESLDRQLQVNLVGPMHLAHAAVPWMLEAGRGHIVNILSVTTTQVFAGTAAYSSAKAGLYMLGKVLAAEYRRRGVRVTAVLPGAADTPIWEGKNFVPNRADMLPADAIADAVAFAVLSPANRSFDEISVMPPKGVL